MLDHLRTMNTLQLQINYYANQKKKKKKQQRENYRYTNARITLIPLKSNKLNIRFEGAA